MGTCDFICAGIPKHRDIIDAALWLFLGLGTRPLADQVTDKEITDSLLEGFEIANKKDDGKKNGLLNTAITTLKSQNVMAKSIDFDPDRSPLPINAMATTVVKQIVDNKKFTSDNVAAILELAKHSTTALNKVLEAQGFSRLWGADHLSKHITGDALFHLLIAYKDESVTKNKIANRLFTNKDYFNNLSSESYKKCFTEKGLLDETAFNRVASAVNITKSSLNGGGDDVTPVKKQVGAGSHAGSDVANLADLDGMDDDGKSQASVLTSSAAAAATARSGSRRLSFTASEGGALHRTSSQSSLTN